MFKLVFPHLFPNEPPIRQVTSDFTKIAAYCPPEIASFLKQGFAPSEGKTYLLVSALGSGEAWGANVNGDYFPERALMHKGASHGYKTFEKYAYVYQHHVNKDPAKAMGRVKIAAYNPVMRRVELLLEIDNEKGAGLIEKVASGEFPDWSMGCKVPYDICSICKHAAKKVTEYCDHLKLGMNKIAADGRRHYAINTLPRFFDISEVLIGADKTAKLLRKVAAANPSTSPYPSALLGLYYYGEDGEKRGAAKAAAIEKEIPVESPYLTPQLRATVESLQAYEPKLPKPVLSKLGGFELPEILSSLSFSGIVLRPDEFQDVVLRKTGRAALADDLEKRGVVFQAPTADEIDGLDLMELWDGQNDLVATEHVKEGAVRLIKPWIPHRSILEPYIHRRVEQMRAAGGPTKTAAVEKTADGPGLPELLTTLGLAYFLYRRKFPVEAKTFEKLLITKPWTGPAIVGGSVAAVNVVDAIAGPSPAARTHGFLEAQQVKVGAIPWKTLGMVVGPIGLAYLTAASAARKEYMGQPLGTFERTVKDYPAVAGLGAAWGLAELRSRLQAKPPTAAKALQLARKLR